MARPGPIFGASLLAVPAALLVVGCASPSSTARARVVSERADLVGGVRATGEIGDFRIENDRIRAIVQGPTPSRVLGIYG
ncbi:MAG: hypothetical protein AB7P00_41765, partial [Sandaracinaceae bacterium]